MKDEKSNAVFAVSSLSANDIKNLISDSGAKRHDVVKFCLDCLMIRYKHNEGDSLGDVSSVISIANEWLSGNVKIAEAKAKSKERELIKYVVRLRPNDGGLKSAAYHMAIVISSDCPAVYELSAALIAHVDFACCENEIELMRELESRLNILVGGTDSEITEEEIDMLTKGDEWKNGDECVYHNKHEGEGGILSFVGIHPTHKDHAVLHGKHLPHSYISAPLSMLSKPETPEQKEARERLERIEQMYLDADGEAWPESGNIKSEDGSYYDAALFVSLSYLHDAGYRK